MSLFIQLTSRDFIAPLILLAYSFFFFRSEILLNVEDASDFVRGLALDDVGHGLASQIQQRLNFQKVSSLE